MKREFNIELKARKGSISYKELAAVLDIHENSVGRWFQKGEMNQVQRLRVLRAIEQIESRKEAAK